MNTYKYELHAHTLESSLCGRVAAAQVVNMHKNAGYQGIVITDHFNEENFQARQASSWNDMIDRYLDGYRNGAEEGVKLDIDVFWGLELRFTENDNDFLVFGVDEGFLREHPFFHTWGIDAFFSRIADRDDILVYQAHPFRSGCFLADNPGIHGIEVCNGNQRHDSRNAAAAGAAHERNLLKLSGSDFHRPEDIDRGGVLFPERLHSIQNLVASLKTLPDDALIIKLCIKTA